MSVTITTRRLKDSVEIRISVQHVSEDGQRLDKKSGKAIEANFMQQVAVKIDNRLIADAFLGGDMSANPELVFKSKGVPVGALISADWLDLKGEKGRAEAHYTG
ncbi:MAG: thiosulfate oxidation carrier complex protein SoxZ [Burkholderiales bacterium]|nr:thiosulfate oxidation carrier complex protein SoxZ [Burkholderiales bacterium]